MYKDKDKQREANRKAQAKFKAKGITKQGITLPEPDLGNTPTTTQTVGAVIPKHKGVTGKALPEDPIVGLCINEVLGEHFNTPTKPKRGKDKPYQMTVMERLFYRPANKLKPGETNFVSLPGRACYGVN